MQGNNKSFRVRTNIGDDSNVHINLTQDYDTFEILSLKVSTEGIYKLHNANYGVIVGRVLANQGFGVPNAKISIFIEAEFDESVTNEMMSIYPFSDTSTSNYTGKRYNLLPDDEVDECHQTVGSFPNKTYMLDNDVILEVFDKYYKYTTRTNNSGDYIICGVPTGNHTLHMDLDLSDCGILSQRPRDFVYKGYTIEQFANPNQFKVSDDLNSLSQIVSQDKPINVVPFWGEANDIETIGITRADINVPFTFEPTCIFMGCIAGDNQSNGISKKCVPTEQMGAMDELVTGEGTIEMIRKTVNGDVEEFQIKGTQLINGDGVWCYQIPMNLDYITTDEYGNTVATDDPSKGIPTRTQVRFRVSMQETEQNMDNYFRAKVLVPHNPENENELDYNFGTKTKDISYRDLFWNNVYTIKSYIPRFQKSKRWKNERFTGIKHCNIYGNNNPIPYNNIRIKLPFMFIILCALIKGLIKIITFVNRVQAFIIRLASDIKIFGSDAEAQQKAAKGMSCTFIGDGLCPDLDGWYFAPGCGKGRNGGAVEILLKNTLSVAMGGSIEDDSNLKQSDYIDENSIDYINGEDEEACLTTNIDYFLSCVEMNLAQEYKVIQFDFYNDWINGLIYMPRWMRQVTKKRSYLFGLIKIKPKTKGCFNDASRFGAHRYYTQQCSLGYAMDEGTSMYNVITSNVGCKKGKEACHKKHGMTMFNIFGKNGGIVNETTNMNNQNIYYFKPCEWVSKGSTKRVILFANDIVLLGSLNACDTKGIPQAFKYLSNSSYKLPTNLALTNMDDMGYLYANNNDTICNNTNTSTTLENTEIGIKRLDSTFVNTLKYSQGVKGGQNSDDYLFYSELDDVIPTTEAAGIAWNYTGPGQGVANGKSVYYPGGHFLGLSCTNSQTNIKSCINLQRICEIGVNISQRREYIKSISKTPISRNGESVDEYKYTMGYHVPTGFISKDEIVGNDFRVMFATLNTNRLIADGIDENTGYPIYNFRFLRPNNFDGSFQSYAIDEEGLHMSDQGVKDSNGVVLQKPYNMNTFQVTNGATDDKLTLNINGPLDYDIEEVINTSTHTIEDGSIDYYLFRYGLNLSDYMSKQNSKFLSNDGNGGYTLPQYENSYYFYFGLKEGATALDEFFKEFFSNCIDDRRKASKPEVSITVEEDACTMTGTITVEVSNMTPNLTYILNKDGKVVREDISTTNVFTIIDVEFGTYNITITDSMNNIINESITFGADIINADIDSEDFTFKTSLLRIDEIYDNAKKTNSGYILIDRKVEVDGQTYDIISNYNNICVSIGDIDGKAFVVSTSAKDESPFLESNNPIFDESKIRYPFKYVLSDTKIKIYLWASSTYDIYIGYKCNYNEPVYTYYTSVDVNSEGEVDLIVGNSQYLSYNKTLKEFTGEWWKDTNNVIYNDNDRYGNPTGWLLRHFLINQKVNGEGFNTNVIGYTNTGKSFKEVLFGEPEYYDNGEYKVSNDICSTEGIIPEGTSLMDNIVYTPTWTYDESFPERSYFGKTVVDEDNSVLGLPLTGITVEKIRKSVINGVETLIVIYSGSNENLIIGHGCVLENNKELYYPIVKTETTMEYRSPKVLPNTINIKNAAVYATFKYPVIYKPFSFEANFMESTLQNITLELNDINIREPHLSYVSNNVSADGIIKNGVTYNNKLGFSQVNNVTVEINGGDNDLKVIEENGKLLLQPVERNYGGNKNIEAYFNKQYNGTTYSVAFSEGAPSNISSTIFNNPTRIILNEIKGEINRCNFFDSFIISENNGKSTISGYPAEGIDETIKYYLVDIDIKNDGKPFIKKEDKLFYKVDLLSNDIFTAYIAAEYINGRNLFVTAKWVDNRMRLSFNKEDGSQIVTELNLDLQDSYDGFSNRYEGCLNANSVMIIEALNELGIKTKPLIEIDINNYSATKYVNKIKNSFEIKVDGIEEYNYDKDNHMIIGFKEEFMEDNINIARIVRLYPELLPEKCFNNSEFEAYLSVIKDFEDDVIFSYEGGTATLTVNSNVSWYSEIINGNGTILLQPSQGDGNGTITVNLGYNKIKQDNENITDGYTESYILVKTADGLIVETINVKQYKSPADRISFKLNEYTMNYNDIWEDNELYSNTEWEIVTNKTWLLVEPEKGKNNSTIRIRNTYAGTAEDAEGIVTARVKGNEGKAAICYIKANKLIPFITNNSNETYNIPYNGGSFEINFTTNITWAASTNSKWINMNIVGGKEGNHTIIVEIPENTTSNILRGNIVIETTADGENKSIVIEVVQETKAKYINIDFGNTGIIFAPKYVSSSILREVLWDEKDSEVEFDDNKDGVNSKYCTLIISSDDWFETQTLTYLVHVGYRHGESTVELKGEMVLDSANFIITNDTTKIMLSVPDDDQLMRRISEGSTLYINGSTTENNIKWGGDITIIPK